MGQRSIFFRLVAISRMNPAMINRDFEIYAQCELCSSKNQDAESVTQLFSLVNWSLKRLNTRKDTIFRNFNTFIVFFVDISLIFFIRRRGYKREFYAFYARRFMQ